MPNEGSYDKNMTLERIKAADPNLLGKVLDFTHRLTRNKFRFVVGTRSGLYSTAWFTRGIGNSYYIGARPFGATMKISLHDDENCRLAFTKEGIAAMKGQGLDVPEDRAFVEWYRNPAPEDGAVHAVSLIFPTDYLRLPAPGASYRKPVLIIDAAPPGKAIEFGFFFSREPQATAMPKFLQIGMPLVRTTLDNGEVVWVVVREIEFDRADIPSEERWAGNVRFHDRAAFLEPGAVERDLTTTFWNSPNDGESLRVIEIGGVTASVQDGVPMFRIEPTR